MYSLIIKITHNVRVKDSIAIARGMIRVATSGLEHSSKQNSSWINSVSEKTHQQKNDNVKGEDQEKPPPSNQSKVKMQMKKEKEYLQNFHQINQSNSSVYNPVESNIPASRIGRFFQFGKLGISLFSASVWAGKNKDQKYFESVGNQISNQLCKMRGAPLKLAQMLSIQEENLIPAPVRRAFEKARESAHIIPPEQVNYMLQKQMGNEWRTKFSDFKEKPFASASIGQVHRATLPQGDQVAVKVQYKSVRQSINSDIQNLSLLLKIPNVFPKTMYMDRILKKTKEQLMQQCDYLREKQYQQKYSKCLQKCLKEESSLFKVPKVYSNYTTEEVFTSEYLQGIKMKDLQENDYEQLLKDQVGRRIMLLTFKQLFQMGIMQSDPNPSNFTYNHKKDQLNLFDFGATHMYRPQFLQQYYKIIQGSVQQDQDKIWQASIATGFVTGEENQAMKNNHIKSILITGQPLRFKGKYDFREQKITQKIYQTIPEMLKNRIKPPPEEVYSLHRKLSGSYLACIRLGARVNCYDIFKQIEFGTSAQNI